MTTNDFVALFNDVQVELTKRIGIAKENRIGQGTAIVGEL